MTAVMVVGNIFITPIYMGVPRAQVLAILPTLLLPFNFIKAILNSAIVMILYKPASTAMKAARVLPRSSADNGNTGSKKTIAFSLIISSVALLVGAICVVVFFVFLGGSFQIWG